MEEVEIKKMIRDINTGNYSSASETLKAIVENKVQERIHEAMTED